MIDLKRLEIWFVTGGQHPYGSETGKRVAAHSCEIPKELIDANAIPVEVVFRPVRKLQIV